MLDFFGTGRKHDYNSSSGSAICQRYPETHLFGCPHTHGGFMKETEFTATTNTYISRL